MTIYTKTGDEGFTRRATEQRVRKNDPVIEASGAIDELNSLLGWCLRAAGDVKAGAICEALEPVQHELLAAGALLAAAGAPTKPPVAISMDAIARMERQIDAAWAQMPELTQFILPGGCELACRLHLARTVCRRAERRLAAAIAAETRTPPIIMKYLNRLSDLLFALARLANHQAGQAEKVWEH